ncbi:MAG: hypothetical protein NVS9B1_13550 [Candidatus Dormibacteraceae bacterium]
MIAVAAGIIGWLVTPATDDVQSRVAALAGARGTRVLEPDEVPALLARAVVAIEDERFYAHHGIDAIGIGRALLNDAGRGCLCEGGSTITQQLVKELYLNFDDRGRAKVVDVMLAFKVELVIDKGRIMADWLSLAPMGPRLYGAAAAACSYFDRPLNALDIAQLALLAGLPQGPSLYDPIANPALALRRRGEVIRAMYGHGFISRDRALAAQAEPLPATARPGC